MTKQPESAQVIQSQAQKGNQKDPDQLIPNGMIFQIVKEMRTEQD